MGRRAANRRLNEIPYRRAGLSRVHADFASCQINMLLIVNMGFTVRYGTADFAIGHAAPSGITALPRVNKINFCADYSQ